MKSIEDRIDQGLGRIPADRVIKNITILNVATGTLEKGDIAICGDTIVGIYDEYDGREVIDGTGLFAVPGFIDTHIHIESTILTPQEFDRCALPLGTTTVVCDPHEIANVLGAEGIEFFLQSKPHMLLDMLVQLPSCVPATGLETAGAVLEAEDLEPFMDRDGVFGLAEFMNIGGVLNKDAKSLAKLRAAAGRSLHVGGHLPGVRGKALNAMLNFVGDCHESTTLPEAREKLEKGGVVFIREGTAAKNSDTLSPLIEPYIASRLGFCSDDRKPTDLKRQGHLDYIIRSMIAKGRDLASVYRIATLSAAVHYKLDDRGLIAPGRKADIVLLNDLNICDIHSVIKNGVTVTDAAFAARKKVTPVGYNSVKLKEARAADFVMTGKGGPVDVIGIIPEQIVTKHLRETLPINARGELQADPARDILKIAVLERHGKNGNIGRSFVQGLDLHGHTIACTVGHDSHNITVVGASDADMALAVNHLRALQGGFVAVKDGVVEAEVPLPIAGLMSDKSYEEVIVELDALGTVVSPQKFLHMAFLPLCVIPDLKLTDCGVTKFDPAAGDLGPRLIDDQRKATI